ncbi:hypothetical protein [Mycolicibacterium porcinum]|uniref:hypothetical protein n=1 Tax=Mycolicibacterium porcinum TaxID=39693 RepID=UPI00256F4A98|nr:hypothetical protein [Mycolicibacterium porcinum]
MAIMLAGGSMHFVAPKLFDRVIPPVLPGSARSYTYASGAAALAIGAGLSMPRTQRTSAALAAGFFVAVMPAKVQLAMDLWRNPRVPGWGKAVGIVQLFWQIPLVTEACKTRRNSEA